MKKYFILLLFLVLLVTLYGCGNSNFEETSVPIDNETTDLINDATDMITEQWAEIYKDRNNVQIPPDGYLEIKNVRFITLKEQCDESFTNLGYDENVRLENVKYVVEYTLFSDYCGSHPYYENVYLYDSVLIYKDGHMAVARTNPFINYIHRYFNSDFSEIIDKVEDFDEKFNTVYNLL